MEDQEHVVQTELMTLFLIFQFKVEEGNELWFSSK